MRAALVFSALVVPLLLTAFGAWFLVDPNAQTVSMVEARALAPWPRFSVAALQKGQYTKDVELFVADHFPLRDHFVRFTSLVRSGFGVRRSATVYVTKGGALGGMERAEEWAPTLELPDAAVAVDPFAEDAGHDDAGEDDAGTGGEPFIVTALDDPAVAGVEEAAVERGGVLIHNGRGLMLLSATDDTARQFATVVSAYGQAFPKLRVYAVMVPGAGAFYLPPAQGDRSANELHNLEVIRSNLPPSVIWVDVAGALEAHADEAIFYRTDHHWTGLGAYYGYRALMRAAQLEPLPRRAFEWKTAATSAPGSLFRMTQDSQLARTADPTSYPVPPVEYQSVSYSGALYDVPHQRRFLDENAPGYLVYLGGDAALLAAKTNVRNGRRVLLVKNSFGNALAPLLLPHFEQVIVADYRMYFRTVAALVKRFKITDVIVQNATLTANDPYHRGRLKLALFTTVTFTDGGVVYGRE
jgi:hypothetical protein